MRWKSSFLAFPQVLFRGIIGTHGRLWHAAIGAGQPVDVVAS